MTNYEAIMLLIQEEVGVLHCDPRGIEEVAKHLAERFDALEEKIAELEAKLAYKEDK